MISLLRCTVVSILFLATSVSLADDWPQWRGPNRDGVWRETGIVEKFATPELKLKWRVPISSGYSGPTVAEGRVYVTDRVTEPGEMERVHCFDWQTGKMLWAHRYDCKYGGIGYTAGPRAAVLVDGGRAYSLGTAGHLFCFDAATGKVVWSHDLRQAYRVRVPTWGIAASPVIEDDPIIAHFGGDDDACVCAFDKVTGQERWKALRDDASYSAPIVITQAGKRVVVCWTRNRIVGLEPAGGRLLWEYPFPWEKWPIAIATPVLHRDLLLFSEAHRGTLLVRLSQTEPRVEKLGHWRKEKVKDGKALHCLISTPMISAAQQ